MMLIRHGQDDSGTVLFWPIGQHERLVSAVGGFLHTLRLRYGGAVSAWSD